MKRIVILLCLAFMLAGCHAKSENDKPQGEQKAAAVATVDNAAVDAEDTVDADDAVADDDDDIMDISMLPATAKRLDSHFQYAIYTNEERVLDDYDDAIVYSVWLADERTGTVRKLCETNPKAEAQWEKMRGENANAVEVTLNQIASAEKAWIAPGDVSKVIVEGCPDARNEWTYIIDANTKTAKQLPSTEGVASLDWEKGEIIVASYGYFPEGGRYTFQSAYDTDGKFLRMVGEKTVE